MDEIQHWQIIKTLSEFVHNVSRSECGKLQAAQWIPGYFSCNDKCYKT